MILDVTLPQSTMDQTRHLYSREELGFEHILWIMFSLDEKIKYFHERKHRFHGLVETEHTAGDSFDRARIGQDFLMSILY